MSHPGDHLAQYHVRLGRRIIIAIVLILATTGLWQLYARPEHRRTAAQPACQPIVFEGSHFTVCRLDPDRHDFRLAASRSDGKPLLTFGNLAKLLGPHSSRVSFAMNAGMYDMHGRPIGLYVEEGREGHPLNEGEGGGNFHLLPNGVFWEDAGGFHVATTDSFAATAPTGIRHATQSGPMLVINGALHPRITPDGPSRKIRNGVGVTAAGLPIFVISDSKVSFGKLARLFRDRLDCPNALFLDGFVSSLWDAASGRFDQDVPLGPMIVVSERGIDTAPSVSRPTR